MRARDELARNADTGLQLEEAARALLDLVNRVEVHAGVEDADNALQSRIVDLEVTLTEAEAARREGRA